MESEAVELRSHAAILQVHWTFPPTTGGVESHLADLARLLAQYERRVIVLTGEENPIGDGNYEIVSTELLNLNSFRESDLHIEDYSRKFAELLAELIVQRDVGIIHGHNLHHFHPGPALAVEEARLKFGVRVYHTIHETWPDVLRSQPVYRRWNGNYAVSRFVQLQCHRLLGFRPRVLPLGVDTNVFKSQSDCFHAHQVPVIFHPARLLPWKGVDVSLRALRLVLSRGQSALLRLTDTQKIADWRGELVAYRTYIRRLIDELQLSSHVIFASAAYREMPRLYESSDIVIYPTIGDEPYGLVPLEAMSCSRPIVASRSGGIVETLIDGVTGYLVPTGDPEALSRRLSQLLANPPLARRLGTAGRQHVQNRFDGERYVETLLRCFDLESAV